MDNTAVLIIVGVLVLAAIAAAAGLFDRGRRVRRTAAARPVERVVERPVVQEPVVEERTTRRVVD